jgi:hypothetical protein
MPRRKKTEYAYILLSYCGSGDSVPPNDRGRLFVDGAARTTGSRVK